MTAVVQLDDHRPFDPAQLTEIRALLSSWYRFSIGGEVGYSPVILTPFVASQKTDPLYDLRYTTPKVMLVMQPAVKAWAEGDDCTLDYVHAAVHHQSKMVVREWLTICCEAGALTIREVDGEVCYEPTRGIIYRVLEIILTMHDCINDHAADALEALEILRCDKDWVSVETPMPKHPLTN